MKFILEIDDEELLEEHKMLSGDDETPEDFDLKMNVEGNLSNYYGDFQLEYYSGLM